MQGRLRDARSHYLEGIASCIRSGNRRNQATIYNNLGLVCSNLREWIEAEIYFGRGIEIAEQIEDGAHIALLLANRATPLIQLGELGRARESLARAEVAARRIDSHHALADIARVRGVLARREGDREAARGHIAESVRIAAEAGLEYERGEALTELGVLYLAEGRLAEATSVLRDARTVLHSLGALRNVDRVERLIAAGSREEWQESGG
jgi:tetratricopeptide (TPR) repeat protein